MPWFSMIGCAERLALDGVVAGELECRARDADRLRGDHRPGPLERAERRRAAPLIAAPGRLLAGSRLATLLGLAALAIRS